MTKNQIMELRMSQKLSKQQSSSKYPNNTFKHSIKMNHRINLSKCFSSLYTGKEEAKAFNDAF